MTARRPALLVPLALLLISHAQAAGPQSAPSTRGVTARPFYMGFTPSVYDTTPRALEDTYAFIGRHADMIAHHFVKGVPWPEAYDRQRYPAAVEQDLRSRELRRAPRQKVFLALSPITAAAEGLGGYWGASGTTDRPGPWKHRDFDDPAVITAYTNFCSDMIQRFRPDFMAYGIEVNGLVKDAPAEWPKFVRFAKVIYAALKGEHPSLPIFVTLQLDYFWADEPAQRKAITEILPYTDYLASSAYPYIHRHVDPRTIPAGYFARLALLAPDKPFAVAETAFTAKDVRAFGTGIPGREEWQDGYVKFLLAEGHRLRAKFVVWFVPRDYDPLVDHLEAWKAPASTIDLYRLWQSTGLVDALGRSRRALETWDVWLHRPQGQ